MDLKPIKATMIVRPEPPPTKIGLIHVPETVPSDNPNFFTMSGEVLAVGPTCEEATIGQRVVFNRYAGRQVKWDGELLLILRENEVVAFKDGAEQVIPGYIDAADSGVKDLNPLTTR